MKLFKVILFFALLLWASPPVSAIYEPTSVANNRYGIHVFDPNELDKASQLVNTSGGEWGYITVPIRANERDLEKWTKFMEEARKKKVIPILRIASFPVGDHWMAPNEWDLVDFANFLNELPWPTKNRYVIVYNEPNHTNEWGGFVYPEEYARVLARAVDIFHQKHPDFFVISGGMDASAPNGVSTMDQYDYMRRMNEVVPGIFTKIDGFSAHAYGNPAFSAAPNTTSKVNVASYRFDEKFLDDLGAPNQRLFLTEVGWNASDIGDDQTAKYYHEAFTKIWTEDNIVAITPFVLEAHDGPFKGFSFVREGGGWKVFAKTLQALPKVAGKPYLTKETSNANANIPTRVVSKGKSAFTDLTYSLSEMLAKVTAFLGIVSN